LGLDGWLLLLEFFFRRVVYVIKRRLFYNSIRISNWIVDNLLNICVIVEHLHSHLKVSESVRIHSADMCVRDLTLADQIEQVVSGQAFLGEME